MEFLTNLSPWHWWALAVLLLAIEIIAPSAFFLWPAAAAAIVGLVLWFQPQIGALAQFLVFSILAVAALAAWKASPWGRPKPAADEPLLNRRAEQYLGRRATVVESFRNGRGEVEIDDTRWRAEALDDTDIEAGVSVRIEQVEGNLLRVARLP